MFCPGHQSNPLINTPRIKTPFRFLAPLAKSPKVLKKEIASYKTVHLNEFLHGADLQPWLDGYGIGATGYTFMDYNRYLLTIQNQFQNDPKLLKRMSVSCDGLLLVSRKHYSPLLGIMSLDLDTNIAESFSKAVGGSPPKIKAVLRELRKELDNLAAESGVTIGDKLPAILEPRTTRPGISQRRRRRSRKTSKREPRRKITPEGSLSGHYKAGSYDAYPLWVGANDES